MFNVSQSIIDVNPCINMKCGHYTQVPQGMNSFD